MWSFKSNASYNSISFNDFYFQRFRKWPLEVLESIFVISIFLIRWGDRALRDVSLRDGTVALLLGEINFIFQRQIASTFYAFGI